LAPRSLPCLCSSQVAFVVARLVLKRSSAGKLLYVGWAATAAVTAVCYRAISSALCERGRCLPSWGGRARGRAACLPHGLLHNRAILPL
jgi:hypothetical protein